MEDYKKYLAERLFTEDKMVTYRILSRALKVHVDVAKAMLYDFHRWQNAMTHGKVHATYLIYGTKKLEVQDDGDVEMTSSAAEGYSHEQVPTQTLTLTSEDRLAEVLSTYQKVLSFQVYSLSAHPLKELQLLPDVSREVLDYSHEDPMERSKKYGTIANPNMTRRDRQGKRPQSASALSSRPVEKKPTATPESSNETKKPTETAAKVKEESKDVPVKEEKVKEEEEEKEKEKPAAKTSKGATPTLKRGGSSSSGGIMSAFSKAAAKASSKSASASSTPKPEEQTPVLSDDGEDDSDFIPAPKKVTQELAADTKKQREEELRRMMEESDGEEPEQKRSRKGEEEEEEEEEEEKEETLEDEPMEEAPEPESKTEPETKAEEEEPTEIVSASGDGRRRGRRRVMKKKQIMDSQGYLVTTQEPGWESFSEDDTPAAAPAPTPTPASSKPKPSSASSSAGSQSSKAKKPGAMSQGSIMSFFSKK